MFIYNVKVIIMEVIRYFPTKGPGRESQPDAREAAREPLEGFSIFSMIISLVIHY